MSFTFPPEGAAEMRGVEPPPRCMPTSAEENPFAAGPGTRRHRYWRADIERIGAGAPRPKQTHRRPASLRPITLITEDGALSWQNAVRLSEYRSVETSPSLLWNPSGARFHETPCPMPPRHLRRC